jgi:hypothetical protein
MNGYKKALQKQRWESRHIDKDNAEAYERALKKQQKAERSKRRFGWFTWFKNWTSADFANKGRWLGTIAIALSSAAYIAMKK